MPYGSTRMGILGAGGGGSFAVTPYTGNGLARSISTGQNIPNSGGLVWIDNVSSGTLFAMIFDTTRGATNYIVPSSSNTENTGTQTLTAFNASGFDVGVSSNVNNNTDSIAAFSWLKSQGYLDIVSYTGNGATQTISHNLAATPTMMIIKSRTRDENWAVYHKDAGNNVEAALNTSSAFATSGSFDNTTPDASDFFVGPSSTTNENSQDYVAYLFGEKAGNSKFGSYTGTGATGNAITGLGFEPSMVILKKTSGAGNWFVVYKDDSGDYLSVEADNTTAAVTRNTDIEFTADGFTHLANWQANFPSDTYIYAAWS